MNTLRLLLALPALAACGEQLEPGAKVDSFRVLAEQVDSPYARPGETVHVSSLLFDPSARPVSWAWASCLNPSSSDLDGCLAKIAESGDVESALLASGVGVDQVDVTIPLDALEGMPAAALPSATLGVVSVACPGELSFGAGPAGLPFRCQEAGGGRELELDEFVVGVKRIGIRESDRNQNPELTSITFDGADWPEGEIKEVGSCDSDEFVYDDCPDTDKHQLGAVLAGGSAESGRDEFGRDFSEQVVVQYFATEGIFEFEVKTSAEPRTGWVARRRASGETLTLWFVARDNRGGVSWTERQVRVR